ncbi:class Ib ribonucleoside-diphosphate reductase assembly flavoprotein NrdI [Nicoliella spurrieriana]|uniref:Class Ib ribonucleoside-diphosphate reductase assembly flavoprotein NrdI n=1 Tax=Nicoliella spurrieriana TaxID=2925830 RepID=A0A976RSV9_9LACO|nr:class Ib ribonucleoside-diphosphate reductase assembly flavoprotein NrdI [Nicoliella spurrieriana]UQS87176.1 class Ib ribonucleoside-diphosphate reductase assembly flavoprotein NrdI [Nicoliella spurrieriana]
MQPIQALFISISGNTRSFMDSLTEYAKTQHANHSASPLFKAREISDVTDLAVESHPYFAFVPTYLDGGNGIDNGVKELMTNSLGEYIAYKSNRNQCLGVIGSGNKNFNEQYCLTAKRYARDYGVPFLDNYELRGTSKDVERVYQSMVNRMKTNSAK